MPAASWIPESGQLMCSSRWEGLLLKLSLGSQGQQIQTSNFIHTFAGCPGWPRLLTIPCISVSFQSVAHRPKLSGLEGSLFYYFLWFCAWWEGVVLLLLMGQRHLMSAVKRQLFRIVPSMPDDWLCVSQGDGHEWPSHVSLRIQQV